LKGFDEGLRPAIANGHYDQDFEARLHNFDLPLRNGYTVLRPGMDAQLTLIGARD